MYVVQFNNLTFLSTHEAKISISNYKHNTSNRPFDIILAREGLQPFFSIVQRVGIAQDPFSVTRIIPQFLFTNSIANSNRCFAFCGLDMSRYKSHSFRIGGACHAADKGYSDAQIRALGHWKSEAFKLY